MKHIKLFLKDVLKLILHPDSLATTIVVGLFIYACVGSDNKVIKSISLSNETLLVKDKQCNTDICYFTITETNKVIDLETNKVIPNITYSNLRLELGNKYHSIKADIVTNNATISIKEVTLHKIYSKDKLYDEYNTFYNIK